MLASKSLNLLNVSKPIHFLNTQNFKGKLNIYKNKKIAITFLIFKYKDQDDKQEKWLTKYKKIVD